MRKRILCFGDSNTYGYIPLGGRYDEDVRWPTVMAGLLGDGYTVIEEGLNGRTCVFDDPVSGGYKSGVGYLPPCLMTHNPLDAVILMLGTNDAKSRFHMSAIDIGRAMTQLITTAKQYALDANGSPSKIIVVSPPPLREEAMNRLDQSIFGAESAEASRALAREYRLHAKLMHCEFLDAGKFAGVSEKDGIHLTAEGHICLARAMAEKALAVLQPERSEP